MSTATQDWVAEAIELQAQGLSERKIAEAVNKAPSTVHAALAKATDDEPAPPSSNGNGSHPVSAEDAARFAASAERGYVEPIPGQTDLDGGEVPPDDDPEWEAPQREMDGGDPVHVTEIVVGGTTQLDLFDLGGKRPQSASIRFAGGKVGLVGGEAFRKGDVIAFSGTAVVTAIKQQDKRDSQTGIVVECEQQHTAHITDLRVS